MTEGSDADDRWMMLAQLVRRRRSLGLHQADVAERMGVTQQTVSRIERRVDTVTLAQAQGYARVVGARLLVTVEMDWPDDTQGVEKVAR